MGLMEGFGRYDNSEKRVQMHIDSDQAVIELVDTGSLSYFDWSRTRPGPVWVRRTLSGGKFCDAEVLEVDEVQLNEDCFSQYVEGSAFGSVGAWLHDIRSRCSNGCGSNGYLHRIEKDNTFWEDHETSITEMFTNHSTGLSD